MKNLFCLAFCLLGGVLLQAQSDTTYTRLSQENGTLEKQQFVSPYEYVFLSKEPVKALFKWNALGVLPNVIGNGAVSGLWNESAGNWRLELAGEWRPHPLAGINLSAAGLFSGEWSPFFDELQLGIEPRWYMDRLSSKGVLNGVYAGFLSEALGEYTYNLTIKGRKMIWDQQHSLRLGIQRRIFEHGYFDINIGAGARSVTHLTINQSGEILKEERNWRNFYDLRVALGWTLSLPGLTKSENRTCDFIQCFREEKQLIKIDLLNLFQQLDDQVQYLRFSAAYERKIGASPWSLSAECTVPVYHNREEYAEPGAGSKAAGLVLALEPRWYFTQKRRIARGRSGNNLAGIYAGLHSGFSWSHSTANRPDFFDYPAEQSARFVSVVPVLGVQQRIFKNGFFEYKIGMGWSRDTHEWIYALGERNVSPWTNDIAFISELKVGLAF